MTIEHIYKLIREIDRDGNSWSLGEFTAQDVVDAYYLGGGSRPKKAKARG